MPTSSSARFSAFMPEESTPAQASGWRRFSASCTGMGDASGPKRKWVRGRCSSSRWRSPRRRPSMPGRSSKPMDRTPIQVLFIEDSEVDVELALRSLDHGVFEVSWDRVDAEQYVRRAFRSAKTQAHLYH